VTATDRAVVFDVDEGRAATIAALLTQAGQRAGRHPAGGPVVCSRPPSAIEALRGDRPALAVVVEADASALAFDGLARFARGRGIPTLGVIDPGDDPEALAGRVREFDDWVAIGSVGRELPARAAGLIDGPGRRSAVPAAPAIDARFLAVVIHDLRTPLNVFVLTIQSMAHSGPQKTAEFDEDLTFLQENARQIEKMLAQLGDYCRLIEGGPEVSGVDFDPRRFLADFLEDRRSGPAGEGDPVRLEVADGCPPEVSLDPSWVKLALQHAVANAVAAGGRSPIRVRADGRPGRLVVEVIVDGPPPPTVEALDLRPGQFERLTGVPAERRGLDLAIAARVSELFGGSARLEIEPGRRSTIVLDWPARIAAG